MVGQFNFGDFAHFDIVGDTELLAPHKYGSSYPWHSQDNLFVVRRPRRFFNRHKSASRPARTIHFIAAFYKK